MMIPALIAAGWVAATAAWTPLKTFTLSCTGTQSGYTDDNPVKQTIPWAQDFAIDLSAGTSCTQACYKPHALSALTADGLDIDNSQGQYGSTLRRYHASTGKVETNIITAASATQRFHVEQSGTCTVKPPGAT